VPIDAGMYMHLTMYDDFILCDVINMIHLYFLSMMQHFRADMVLVVNM